MYSHTDIWATLDILAARLGYSPSGLAKKAGLDPTSFNKSKRESAEGKPRWPSTESIAKVLNVADMSMSEFFKITDSAKTGEDTTDIDSKVAARILLSTKSVLINAREPFTYTSGRQGPVYVDCRRLISFPKERDTLMNMGAAMIREHCPDLDLLAGGETAGIPYAAFLSERLNLPMLYVRKKPKGFGRMAQIEGCMDEQGKNVILVEDLQTDGGSKKLFIDVLREAGAKVEHAFVVFHYGIFEASTRNMTELGIKLHALTDWWTVLEVAKEDNSFDTETLDSVEAFLNNPEGWQPAQTGS